MKMRKLVSVVFLLALTATMPASAYLKRVTGVTTEWSLALENATVEDLDVVVVETGATALLCYERFPEPGVRTVQAQAATGGALCCVGLTFKEENGSLWVKKAYAGYVSGNVPGSYDFDQGGYTVMTTHSSDYYNVKSIDLRTSDPKPGRPDVTLPAGTEELQYIESSGTQYLDSGVNAANGLYACADATLLEGNYTVGLFGILRHLGMYLYQGSTLYCYHKGGTKSVRNIDPGYRHLYTASNAVYRVDNVLIGSVAEPDFAGTSMYVFAMRKESGSDVFDGKAKMRLYGFVVRSTATGETLCDLVPCKDPNGVVCCYDAAAGEFRYNQGTGEFTPGPGMNFINVEGSPNAYGKPDPGYGVREGLVSGTSYTFTAPAAFSNAVGNTRYTCLGWKIVKADGTETDVVEASEATIPYSSEYAASSLVWLWAVEHKVTAEVFGVGGMVTPAEQWVEAGGETTVTAASAPGSDGEFIKWRGDGVTEENETSATIDLVVDNPMTLTADFGVPGALLPSGGDDTAQIAAAIAALGEAGGVVNLGPGTFTLAQQLSNAVPVRIVGSGSAFTTIVSSGTAQPQRTVYLNHPQATVERCTLVGRSSSAGLKGMVVLVDSLGGCVEDCVVTGGHAGANVYGALYLAGSSAFADRCVITGNSGGVHTGGLEINGGHAASCLVCGNDDLFAQDNRAGGIYLAAGGTVSNCTVTANTGVNIGGIWVKDGTVVNTISCGNVVGLTCDNGYSGTADRHGAEASFVNCLFEDPGFADAANGDYRLIPSSAAIDASVGDEIFSGAKDLGGNSRRVRRADIGCYEQQGDTDQLWIVGEPDEYAASQVTPGYGVINGLSDGSAFPCTAPAEIDDGGTAATCTGWELYGQNAETYEWTLLRRSTNENKLQCDFAYPATPMRTKLVWKWAALLKAEATATAGGSASVDRSAYAFGDTVTAVATPASDAVVFSRWTGDVPTGKERENPLVFSADRPCALVAHFVAKRTYVKPATDMAATPSAPYATPETATTDVFGVMDSDDLVDGCEIVFLDGEHSIDRQLEAAVAALVIRSENGAAKTTVRCTTSGKRVILLDNANAVVRGLKLVGNANGPNGTVVMVDKHGGKVEDCVLTGASSSASGALYLTGSAAFADRCVITGNSGAIWTSALYVSGGHAANCLIYGNRSHPDPGQLRVGGIYLTGGGTVSNCTVTANTGINVGGIQIVNSGTVVNTISYGNIQGGTFGDYTGSVEWTGTAANFVNCLFEDPHFRNAAENDYTLRRGSPAINAGVNGCWGADAVDLAGNARVFNFGKKSGIVDLGCYESPYGTPGFLLLIK